MTADLPNSRQPSPGPRTERFRPATHHPLHLLVVDDEETVRRSLSRYLRRCGHRVDEAVNGQEALQMLDRVAEEASYDVILCDLKMPVMSGDQLLLELRDRGGDLHSRIIFLTGAEPSGEAASVIGAAGSPVVLKPYDLLELGRLVEEYAGGTGSGPDAT